MPAKIKVNREKILNAALELIREGSSKALSARNLAGRLNCSTQPIFSNFPNMQELYASVIAAAWKLYTDRTTHDMKKGRYIPYKASGMSYISFAVEEPNLFRLLFMRDRIADGDADTNAEVSGVIDAIVKGAGISREQAERLHENMWIYVHGLAVMFVTGFSTYDEEAVSERLSEVYNALIAQYKESKE